MTKQRLIPFLKSPKKASADGLLMDQGTFGNLQYEIYKRGVIHIFDDQHRFKKDMNYFEDEILKHDFKSMSDGEEIVIKGSGDNDHLVFKKTGGDIDISLRPKGFEAIDKLKDILAKGMKKVQGMEKE